MEDVDLYGDGLATELVPQDTLVQQVNTLSHFWPDSCFSAIAVTNMVLNIWYLTPIFNTPQAPVPMHHQQQIKAEVPVLAPLPMPPMQVHRIN